MATALGQVTCKLVIKKVWHTMGVQRINFLHLNKGRLTVYMYGAQVGDAVIPQDGRVG